MTSPSTPALIVLLAQCLTEELKIIKQQSGSNASNCHERIVRLSAKMTGCFQGCIQLQMMHATLWSQVIKSPCIVQTGKYISKSSINSSIKESYTYPCKCTHWQVVADKILYCVVKGLNWTSTDQWAGNCCSCSLRTTTREKCIKLLHDLLFKCTESSQENANPKPGFSWS